MRPEKGDRPRVCNPATEGMLNIQHLHILSEVLVDDTDTIELEGGGRGGSGGRGRDTRATRATA
jgi:hypothetical protein